MAYGFGIIGGIFFKLNYQVDDMVSNSYIITSESKAIQLVFDVNVIFPEGGPTQVSMRVNV